MIQSKHTDHNIMVSPCKKCKAQWLTDKYRCALETYANPEFYHGCAFMFDRPTGGFDEDFDFDDEYQRPMPGKLARKVLDEKTSGKKPTGRRL